jgi:hypothetical protein
VKCPHCSASVERKEWFCHNCKRSLPKPERRALPWRAMLVGGVAAAFLGLAAAAVAQSGWGPAQPAERQASPAAGVSHSASAGIVRQALAAHGFNGGAPAPVSIPAGQQASVSVVTTPGVKTFVYLNGGSLLGEAPLRSVAIPAGKQKLTLWAPSIGGRTTREVDVEPGGNAVVLENLQGKTTFASR